ncbi:MAG: hypothetical protein AAF702_02835 [Chloroflexota bacterium]
MSELNSFNLETMSGVFPGTRTQRHHTVRLLRSMIYQGTRNQASQWAKVFWHEESASAIVLQQGGEQLIQFKLRTGDEASALLQQALMDIGWRLSTCGSCRFWHQDKQKADEGLPRGDCRWSGQENEARAADGNESFYYELAVQGALTLFCPQWQVRNTHAEELDVVGHQPPYMASLEDNGDLTTAPIKEPSPNWLHRLLRRFNVRKEDRPQENENRQGSLLAQMERSGVGAGTDPCPGCYGRIANLGAYVLETDEGDQQTLSIWRCRVCHGTYLNSWIDRWTRLDTLETEETLYRLAPWEAAQIVAQLCNFQNSQRLSRRSRELPKPHQDEIDPGDSMDEWLLSWVQNRQALTHQIRHGR